MAPAAIIILRSYTKDLNVSPKTQIRETSISCSPPKQLQQLLLLAPRVLRVRTDCARPCPCPLLRPLLFLECPLSHLHLKLGTCPSHTRSHAVSSEQFLLAPPRCSQGLHSYPLASFYDSLLLLPLKLEFPEDLSAWSPQHQHTADAQ